ncbi:Gfo/Idh/MocA family oxidoreductase [Pseudarthrobacter psychrotolerans]|uniref:Gfo/Idh/MocA family oxidoreductase n=1 Tax=Pseudarthrobacter psychrotolerans TaxID=2697569 RepID=A0A6P1NM00_9MICC|nr:Gfo/Idh/MocA family oxidoreductase [Pseudarthrobacter psychrotolerans]QHK20328.1 Gfo/Idh/MocA family oxidoreductase [Pseudarthrobacter psychrotolerans]
MHIMEKDLKVGIVGFGLRAGLWRHAHKPGQGSEVTIVCDTSERGRADAAERIPSARITADLEELLGSGIDAVLVLTPDNQHAAVAVRTLRAGIATFCEKPLDVTIEAADLILQTAYDTGTRLYVGHNMRHMPVVVQMRKLIEEGRIGEVKAIWCRHFVGHGGDYYFKDWHSERKNVTSLLLQKGAHDIDVIHWLAKGYTQRVSAVGDLAVYGSVTTRSDNSGKRMGDWYSLANWPPSEQQDLAATIDIEDISMMNMVLDNGVLASYQQCHFTPDYWRNYTIIGTKGRIENFGDGPGDKIKVWTTRTSGFAEPDDVIEIQDGGGGHGGADPNLIAEFLRFAAEGGRTQTSPIAARQAVAAGVLAAESLRGNGSAREVPAVPADLMGYFNAGQPAKSPELAL